MKTSFWRPWSNSLRSAKPTRPISRVKPRRPPLSLESLEDRFLLSLTPQLVLDINATTLFSNPSQIVAVGSVAYFIADDGVHGLELWKSDGTEAGTALVKDVSPGTASSNPASLTNVNGTLFFTADDGVHGPELWKSDGTAAGTALVKDIFANSGGSGPGLLTNVNGTLFFSAYTDATGFELWKSDGSTAGTVLVKDVVPGWESFQAHEMINVDGTLFFSTHDYFNTFSRLWKSDGTSAGTVLVKDFVPFLDGDNFARNLASVNATLFFTVKDEAHGSELWKSDGSTAGTVLVKDIATGLPSSSPRNLTNVNGTLFFSANDGFGEELWKSNGTAAGTTLVKNIFAEPPGGYGGSSPSKLTNVNGTLFFKASSGTTANGLWKSDGTAAGTVLIRDIVSWSDTSLTNVNGTLFFSADDGVHGIELWKSDGTTAGTIPVTDIRAAGRTSSYPSSLANVNGTLFFSANDGTHGVELWKSDGTAAGTALVKDIHTSSLSSSPSNLLDVSGTLFFSANDGAHGVELWKSDGTVAGTTLVKDVFPGGYTGYYGGYYPHGSSPSNLTNVNGTLFFTVWNAGTGTQLWKSDGTEAGTLKVGSLAAASLTNVNGTLFFTAYDGSGTELWKSDGTTAGTTRVKDIYPGSTWIYYSGYYGGSWSYVPNSSSPSSLTNLNGTLFFTADDGTNGRELWRSDGTELGTVLVNDIHAGPNSSSSANLTNVSGTLFFTASGGTNGNELWKSDGTAAGTVLIKDIRPGNASSYPRSLTDVNGTLFLTADDGTNGSELWKSDGTAAGTTSVKDIYPGTHREYGYYEYGDVPNSSFPSNLTNANGTLFFTAQDGPNGRELWKSDGTAAGTVLVKDIRPGNSNSYLYSVTHVNGTLFFTAYDGTARQIWQSDGTAAGTAPVANIYANWLTTVNDTLFFAAEDAIRGSELWMLFEDGLPSLTIGEVTVIEGHTETRSATFTVTLSVAFDQPVTVVYTTTDGAATAGSDYQAISGTLTFAPGDTSKTITVPVYGDRRGEPDETFLVNLSNPTNATIRDGQGAGTILDDEPRIRISDMTMAEGNSGTTAVVFTVSLSAAYDVPVTVGYATGNGTATASTDYQAAVGTLAIAAGFTSQTISIPVRGDRLAEQTETFVVNLSDAANASIADGQAIATIVDDEPRISISDVSKSEGKRGKTTVFSFTVTLSAAYDQAVTMSFQTVNGTAKTGDNDYVAKSGTLTFAPGEPLTKTITIEVKGDGKREANEEFYLDLVGLSSNALFTKNRGIGSILNDD